MKSNHFAKISEIREVVQELSCSVNLHIPSHFQLHWALDWTSTYAYRITISTWYANLLKIKIRERSVESFENDKKESKLVPKYLFW